MNEPRTAPRDVREPHVPERNGAERNVPQQNVRDDNQLCEDGITNPKDGRGPLRKSDDQSTGLPVNPDGKPPMN